MQPMEGYRGGLRNESAPSPVQDTAFSDPLASISLLFCTRENLAYIKRHGRREKPGVRYSACAELLCRMYGGSAQVRSGQKLRRDTLGHFGLKSQRDFHDLVVHCGLRPLWHVAMCIESQQELQYVCSKLGWDAGVLDLEEADFSRSLCERQDAAAQHLAAAKGKMWKWAHPDPSQVVSLESDSECESDVSDWGPSPIENDNKVEDLSFSGIAAVAEMLGLDIQKIPASSVVSMVQDRLEAKYGVGALVRVTHNDPCKMYELIPAVIHSYSHYIFILTFIVFLCSHSTIACALPREHCTSILHHHHYQCRYCGSARHLIHKLGVI